MLERYYTVPEVLQESADTLRGASGRAAPRSLRVPGAIGPILRQEAFYCRASGEDMPGRVVLYGTAILSLVNKGASLGFTVAHSAGGGNGAVPRRIPFVYPMPGEGDIDETKAVVARIQGGAATETEVSLDGPTSKILADHCESSGLSPEDDFVALAGLINFIGTSEREGLMLSVQQQGAIK